MRILTRRDFLGVCAAATSLSVSVEGAEPPMYVYASESNAPALPGSALVVGFLLTRSPTRHIAAIRSIKIGTRYGSPLKYHSTDAFKVGCAREVLLYFSRDPDLRFVARVVSSPRSADLKSDAFRVSHYPELFVNANLPAGSILRMKQRRTTWNENRGLGGLEYTARVNALLASKRIASAESIQKSARDGLMELSNLLNGTLFNAWVAREHPYATNEVKRAVALRLRTALGVSNLLTTVPGKWEPTTIIHTA